MNVQQWIYVISCFGIFLKKVSDKASSWETTDKQLTADKHGPAAGDRESDDIPSLGHKQGPPLNCAFCHRVKSPLYFVLLLTFSKLYQYT